MRSASIVLLLVTLTSLLTLSVRQPTPLSAQASGLTSQNAPTANQTLILQQGLNGYTGVRDTWISTASWATPPQRTVNYGQNATIVVTRNDGDNSLLRFDLSGIPADSAIISASLSLYNTTQSSIDGSSDFVRRVQLFPVLSDWDEGNQDSSPIDAAGKRGATGDQAFDYFTGEGTDVAWGVLGMEAGTDYADIEENHIDVINQGWYSVDLTALVRAWVRSEQANYGVVLRDATGYADNHNESRVFVASQGTEAGNRPKLTVVYNADVPFANAGVDQENLNWNGSAVTLDGSASRDRVGGNDATLTYTWRIAQAAYGSALSGNLVTNSPNATFNFTPDVAGEWEIELVVTNSLDESATDRVNLRLLKIPVGHPRIFLTPDKLLTLKAQAVANNARWTQVLSEADADDGEMPAKALAFQITGQAAYGDQAITAALALIADPNDYPTKAGEIALIYDWCYSRLSPAQRTTFIDYFNTWGDDNPKTEDFAGWGNYWPRHGYSYALVGLASYGDNPRGQEWLDEYRHRRFAENDLSLLTRIAAGGAWPEGMVYDWIANYGRIKAVEAWRTATGEDLFASTTWFEDRLGYFLLHRFPGLAEQFGFQFHPYPSIGDSDRNRGSLTNYERIMALILIERFATTPPARQLQAYLAAPPTNNSLSFLYHDEFLWFNSEQPSTPPTELSHYAAGTGALYVRSGWPDGAADGDLSATHITFQSGDHFTYHQHYDQNSFTLFKYGDLLIDSGVYSGEALSNHDINYYVRTIAHNTLVVYNPAEDFAATRPDASSNDGGQRSPLPATRSPQTIAYFDQNTVHYDTGDMLHFEDTSSYAYALGDATKAYNNPTYNQAMDTALSSNTAKVSRFQREFVYLRSQTLPPEENAVGESGEYLVLFDRVGVTQESFSGANTKLLFHTLSEPTVNGTASVVSPGETLYANADLATAVSGEGKIFIKTLLPATRNLRKVGGRGEKSFWAFDDNYDWHWADSEPQPRPFNDFESVPYGEWRLELEPADSQLEHNFLTVLYPTTSDTTTMPATLLINGTGVVGSHIADAALNRVTLFSASTDGSAPAGALAYSYTPTARTQHLLVDLTPGTRYKLTQVQQGAAQRVTLTPDNNGTYTVSSQGTLSFVLQMDGEVPIDPFGAYLPLITD